MIDLAKIARQGFQGEIKLIQRHGAVVDDYLVIVFFAAVIGIIGAQNCLQAVAVPRNRTETPCDREGGVFGLQVAHVWHQIHCHHVRRKGPVAGHDLHFGPGCCNQTGGL